LFWLIERRSNPEHFGEGPIKGVSTGIYWVGSTLASGVCFGITLKSAWARILGLIWMLVLPLLLVPLSLHSPTLSLKAEHGLKVIEEDTLKADAPWRVLRVARSPRCSRAWRRVHPVPGGRGCLERFNESQIDGFLYDEITLSYYRDHDYKGKDSSLSHRA